VTAGCSTADATTCGVAPGRRARQASAAPASAQLLDSVPHAVNTTSPGCAAPTTAATAARASSSARLLCAAPRGGPVVGRVGRGAGRVRCATWHHPLEQASHEGPGYLKMLRSRWWGKSSRRWGRRRCTGARLAAVDVRAGGVAKALAQEGKGAMAWATCDRKSAAA